MQALAHASLVANGLAAGVRGARQGSTVDFVAENAAHCPVVRLEALLIVRTTHTRARALTRAHTQTHSTAHTSLGDATRPPAALPCRASGNRPDRVCRCNSPLCLQRTSDDLERLAAEREEKLAQVGGCARERRIAGSGAGLRSHLRSLP